MEEFIINFADVFDDTELDQFSSSTNFKDLKEWSSLHALATLNMIEMKYGVKLEAARLMKTSTIQELFDLVKSNL